MNFLKLFSIIPTVYAADIDLNQQYGFAKFGSIGSLLHTLEPMMFSIATIGVIFYFAIGAFKWITSGGDKNALDGARNMMTHAVIGIFMLIMLFLVLQYIPQAIGLGSSYKIINWP